MSTDRHALQTRLHQAIEWTLKSSKQRQDPWGEIALVAILTGDDGTELRIPAFWAGGQDWRFRLTAPAVGTWRVRTDCTDSADTGLHNQEAVLEISKPDATETNALFRHGPVRLAASGDHFEHADGTVFHWLADTWWMVLSERISWPEGFKRLTARRVEQGFSVGQVVVGFPPDTTPFDGRDANAGGSPWLEGYESINPAYFDAADRRLEHMIEQGIIPCILGGWGYHLLFMGAERMAEHWRYLVARYASWPVVWCLAGEGAMPYYLSGTKDADIERLRAAWPAIARQVRAQDPFNRPLTLHPRRRSWDDTTEPETLDFHMIQPSHLPNAPKLGLEALKEGRAALPGKIIINAEPPYEGHAGTNLADVQRFSFWASMLSGSGGYTYGAAGIFQANDRDRPTGNRPDGGAFDAVFWDDAMMFPGAEQVAKGHALLASLGYEKFEPHPEWAEITLRDRGEAYPLLPRAYAAGVPGEVRLIYCALRWYHWEGPLVRDLEPGIRYKATYIEPGDFKRFELGEIEGDAKGEWRAPTLPHMFDWLLLLTKV